MMSLILSALTLVITGVGAVYEYNVAKEGSVVRDKIGRLATAIKTKIAKNNALLSQLQQAYSSKNQALVNKLFNGLGFGPRIEALRKEIAKNDLNYETKLKDINKQNVDLEKQNNLLDSGYANTGSSLKGNVLAEKGYKQVLANTEADLNQNVQGGVQNEKEL